MGSEVEGGKEFVEQNKYDDPLFFEKYSGMERSQKGLEAAGEWHDLQKMLPDFRGKRVLDLGCGYGWHCRYAVEHGAVAVVGVDSSEKMLAEAGKRSGPGTIEYLHRRIEDIEFPEASFDAAISSLAFHYIESIENVYRRVNHCLSDRGDFVFSVEHPVFTAQGPQDWCYDDHGKIRHWPVDSYFSEGPRDATFLGEKVLKFHRTLTTYLGSLLRTGFEITGIVEPRPPEPLLNSVSGMRDELRRPMMLIVSARKLYPLGPPSL